MPRIVITGDFCPNLRLKNAVLGRDGSVFGPLSRLISNAQLAITNLECPITEINDPIIKTGPHLKGIMKAANFLKDSGFDLVTLANNHIMDHGPQGLQETLTALDNAGIQHLGAGSDFDQASKAYRLEINDVNVSILNFAENEWSTTFSDKPGASPMDPVRNYYLINQESGWADHVIVIAHGGHEMHAYPSPRMKELYRFYIDAGATVVVSHHTHCISGFEYYNNGFIHYSVGNFLFDHKNYRSNIWNYGAAILLEISKKDFQSEIIYFKQCSSGPFIEDLSIDEGEMINKKVDQINAAIQNSEELNIVYNSFLNEREKMYRAYIEPFRFRLLNALQNKGLFPSFWSKRKKQFLLNLARCESHREHLIKLLEKDVSDPSK